MSPASASGFARVARFARRHRDHAMALGSEIVRLFVRFIGDLRDRRERPDRTLGDAQAFAVAIDDERLRHARGGIEGRELQKALDGVLALRLCRFLQRRIDGIEIGERARKRRQTQDARAVVARHRHDVGHLHGIARQRARLVGAQDIHARGLVSGRQAREEHALARQGLRAERRRQSKRRGQGDGDRGEQRREAEKGHVERVQARDEMRVENDDERDGAVQGGEVLHRAHDRGLLGARGMGEAHKLGGAPEIGAGARRRDFRDRLAAANERAGIEQVARRRVHGHGFAGEHRLIHEHRARGEARIGRNDGAERQTDHVARHELCRRTLRPGAVAADEGGGREPLLQRRERSARAALLRHGQSDIEHEERADDAGFHILAERHLQHDGGFEQPWHRRPELAEQAPPHRMRLFGHRVRAMRGKARRGLAARKA